MRQPKLSVVDERPHCQTPTPNTVRGWIEACRSRSETDVLVTPEIAGVLMEYNRPGETNRKVSPRYVDAAVRALEQAQWQNTGEPIIVSDTRLLNDGQHRLLAVIRSGIPAIMDLRFGVAREAYGATNTGRKRSAGDALAMFSPANNFAVGSCCRMVIAYKEGLPGSLYRTATNPEIVAAYQRWPEMQEAVRITSNIGPGFRTSIVYAIIFFALRTCNSPGVDQFVEVMRTGGGDIENPPHRFREYVLRNHVSQDREKRAHAMAVGIIAWNAWASGKRSVPPLLWRTNMPFPTVDKLKL